jgi:hypothetical protein
MTRTIFALFSVAVLASALICGCGLPANFDLEKNPVLQVKKLDLMLRMRQEEKKRFPTTEADLSDLLTQEKGWSGMKVVLRVVKELPSSSSSELKAKTEPETIHYIVDETGEKFLLHVMTEMDGKAAVFAVGSNTEGEYYTIESQ